MKTFQFNSQVILFNPKISVSSVKTFFCRSQKSQLQFTEGQSHSRSHMTHVNSTTVCNRQKHTHYPSHQIVIVMAWL